MIGENPGKHSLRIPRGGLLVQLITTILLPMTILVVAITFGSLSIHQQAMRTMVGERDQRLVETAARALSAQIDLRSKELTAVALLLSAKPSEPVSTTFSNAANLVQDFDLGLVVFDAQGQKLAVGGNPLLWDAWTADTPGSLIEVNHLGQNTGSLEVITSPINGAYTGLFSAPVEGNRTIVGAFSITVLVENTLVDILPYSGQLSVMLVDSEHRVLYQAGNSQDNPNSHPGVTEALQGQSGTVYVKVPGDEHVTAYSPVSSAPWALVTEESWQAVSTPTLRTTQVAPLVLVPALVIMLLALWLGARQVVQPLRALEAKAVTLAEGDYQSIQQPVGGIPEIQNLQKELAAMAVRVQEAQRSLHGYIGSITAAQEDERRRLARELHDDTLQALIALKQRLQLAQLEQVGEGASTPPEVAELEQIEAMTGRTIENLRRLTGALRPAYLDDLGLVPALEMLARETGQGMGVAITFYHTGVERRLAPPTELALYRMAQEALNNVVRHAHTGEATISISYASKSVTLQVEDHGIGFTLPGSQAGYAASGHYGLVSLHERAELIGARLSIQTSPGSGTRVTVVVPA